MLAPSVSLLAPVGVVYSSDMKLVRGTLEAAATGLAWRSPEKDPVVILRAFGSSSVEFEVSVWIEDPWIIGQYVSDLNEAIWWSLKDAGVVIAFPQLDVHFDPPVMESLEGLQRIKRSTVAGGVLAVWSAYPDPVFDKILRKGGFDASSQTVRGHGTKSWRHTIFVARVPA